MVIADTKILYLIDTYIIFCNPTICPDLCSQAGQELRARYPTIPVLQLLEVEPDEDGY